MTHKIEHAFILAAGHGSRLRPHTNDKPKPMVALNGKPIIDYTIDKIKQFGIHNITINLYYLGDVIKKYFASPQDINITYSQENELLDTGGGVKKALHNMQGKPFFLINGDAFWQDRTSSSSALEQLAKAWDPEKMDILLLLQPVDTMQLTQGVGDYNIQHNCQITRTADKSGSHMFTGIRIVHPRVFENTPDDAFSFLECMDQVQEEGTLYGISYDGQWHHISTPEDLSRVNQALSQNQNIHRQSA